MSEERVSFAVQSVYLCESLNPKYFEATLQGLEAGSSPARPAPRRRRRLAGRRAGTPRAAPQPVPAGYFLYLGKQQDASLSSESPCKLLFNIKLYNMEALGDRKAGNRTGGGYFQQVDHVKQGGGGMIPV